MYDRVPLLIQARLNSTRLPGKVLLPIVNIPLISILLNRLDSSLSPLFVLTSDSDKDISLINFLFSHHSSGVYAGSESNVAMRYLSFLRDHGFDSCIRITADNPFTSITLIRQTLFLASYFRLPYFSFNKTTLPEGLKAEFFTTDYLEEQFNAYNADPYFCEHVTPYMPQNLELPCVGPVLPTKPSPFLLTKSFTIDTVEDINSVREFADQLTTSQFEMISSGAIDILDFLSFDDSFYRCLQGRKDIKDCQN